MNIETMTLGLVAVNTAGLGYIFWQRTVGENRRFKHQMVVDTSGLIDGRIMDIVRSGFVPQRLIIPQFVVAELQFLADQGDAFKRERARFGLDVIRQLQDMRQTDVVISAGRVRGEKAVDDKLVALAKKHGALLYTTDFNLNQVAQIEGVNVLNVNELAQGIRATFLPGERAEIKITSVGQDRSQGVGYLEDGTMVVVENAGKLLNQKTLVVFSRMLQTQAGKMMFATLPGARSHHDDLAHHSIGSHHAARKPQHNNNHVAPQQQVISQMAPVPAQQPIVAKQQQKQPVQQQAARREQPRRTVQSVEQKMIQAVAAQQPAGPTLPPTGSADTQQPGVKSKPRRRRRNSQAAPKDET